MPFPASLRSLVARAVVARAAVALVLLAPAASAGAQIIRVPPRGLGGEPRLWASAAVGWAQIQGFVDGSTSTVWDFGDAAQFRGSLEARVARGVTAGVAATWARVPLRYGSGAGFVNADADVTSIVATVHGGGVTGLHQVFDISAGAIIYDNFKADGGGTLAPEKADPDFMFSLGYGFGYAVNSALRVTLVQDAVFAIHQQGASDNDNRRTSQQYITRIGVRLGFARGR
ncbi:MAG TPA: hypothetical protein VNA89_14705 [Gemmatimonadaceae bacterium]|nr:hypothetical protein [Gemmatimonadaceae bacterium]